MDPSARSQSGSVWIPVPATVIGVVSDSHGEADRTETALRSLEAAGADLFIHLGDLESEAVVDRLAGRPSRIVLGNVDVPELARYASFLGIDVDHPVMRLEVGGRRIGATHGHLESELDRLASERPDHLLHGHTHRIRDERVEGMRILNPGAIARSPRCTAAILEPAADRFEIIEIPVE
ncbi:MAG: hypothetical protein GY895_09715 [Phycisphaera sp.]|nr:hypothetical protein [Phycisphaera sp.]